MDKQIENARNVGLTKEQVEHILGDKKPVKKIIQDDDLIIYSDLVEEELQVIYSEKEIKKIFSIAPKEILVKVSNSIKQLKEAIHYSKRFNIPKKDALHAVLARDNEAILVTRDKHFYELTRDIIVKKPEELI